MNAIIVAVCVNIALVNANNDIDLDTILRILKINESTIIIGSGMTMGLASLEIKPPVRDGYGRRFTNKQEGANDHVEVMRIIPGFYLETPKYEPKSLFRYPKTKHSNVYGRFNMDDNRHEEKKSLVSNINLRNDYLTSKLLRAIKNLDQFRSKKKYEQVYERTPKSEDKLLVENLLANSIIGERNLNSFQGYEKYGKSEESYPAIKSKTADTLLIEKLLANILNDVETNNAIEDRETYKYGTADENIWSSESSYGNLLQKLLETVQNSNQYRGHDKRSSLIVVETNPTLVSRSQPHTIKDTLNDESTSLNNVLTNESENNANEVLDDLLNDEDESEDVYYDRHRHHHHTRRQDVNCTRDSLEADTKEGSLEQEKNPGNPFTVHKNKYKQNWLWNHFMDGSHMNINPFGPQFASLGPSGPELFFGRKWWYFNQDDYKPMG